MIFILNFQSILEILKVNLRIAFLNNIFLSFILLILTPVIFSINNVDFFMASKICEQFVSIIGILILVPIFEPEEDKNIKDVLKIKRISLTFVYVIRVLMAILLIILLISLVVNVLIYCGGYFDLQKLIVGTFASALFLGALGLFMFSLTENLGLGYMTPILYFIFDMMTKGKHTKNLFIFSLMNNSFNEKYYLLLTSAVLITVSLINYCIKNSKA